MDEEGAVWLPSPNFWEGRANNQIKAVVLHGTAGPNAAQWFSNPSSNVSAHYVVEEDGSIEQCVREADSAWHAGVVTPDSAYADSVNLNLWSIGVEHTRNIQNNNPMPEAQIQASLTLCQHIIRRNPTVTKFIKHDEIDVGRVCPGPLFPFNRFVWLLGGNMEILFEEQWKSYKPDAIINKDAAIWKYWVERRLAGDYSLGVPTSQEFAYGKGVAQLFTNVVVTWDSTQGVKVY